MNARKLFLGVLMWSACLLCPAQQLIENQMSSRRFTTLDGLSQMQTETVWQDSRGYIYIGTLSGFVRFDGESLTPFLRGQRENIVGFQEVMDSDHHIEEVRAMGFVRQWRVDGEEAAMMPIDPKGELLLNNFNAADLPPGYVLLEDRQEQNRVLCRVKADEMERVVALPLFDEMTPDRKMYIDSAACIYVPTPKGLFCSDGQHAIRKLSDKPDVFSLIRSGDRLYALAGDGIYSVEDDRLVLRCKHYFEAPDYGLAVRENRQGQLIVADSHTIWLYDEQAGQPMRQLASGFNLIKGLLVDRWNRLWVATYQGAYCFFHCNFVNHRLTDQNDIVRAMAVDEDGRMVMGTLNGKVLVDGKMISSQDDNFFAPNAVSLAGKVYMAGHGDVACVQGDTVRWLGLPFDKYQFVSRYADRLVIGTRSSVLAYDADSGRLDTLTTEIVRPWCAADDGQGRLWVSGNPGLYLLTDVEGGHPTIEKIKSTPTTLVITTMATDGRGRVCFALGDSLFAINQGEVRAMTEVLPLLKGHEIRTLHVVTGGYLVVAAIDGLMVARLDETCHASDIRWFDARSGFTMIEPLMATMAEGKDGRVWLAGLEEMVSFSPEELLENNLESTVIVPPRPWWQQWWAGLVAVVLLSLLVWCVARWFEQRQARKKMNRLKREKTQKELQLSTIRLKAIPHFHANVLASIEYFMMNNSADEATHYLKLYSDFTNQTLSDIDRPSRSVADEVDYARAYLELEQLRYGERLQYSITVEPQVDQKVMLPTMLLHTYCQNAVKHGIANKAGVGHVTVTVSSERRDGAEGVLVAVSDDGVGRSEAAHAGEPSTKQGLKILSQQIELYNRTNQHQIVQRVTDLTDAGGHPAGTRFDTWVPAGFKY